MPLPRGHCFPDKPSALGGRGAGKIREFCRKRVIADYRDRERRVRFRKRALRPFDVTQEFVQECRFDAPFEHRGIAVGLGCGWKHRGDSNEREPSGRELPPSPEPRV
jgi:hypothetical protein